MKLIAKSLLQSTPPKKKLGKNILFREDWTEENRISIMSYLVFQKFSKDSHLRNKLIATGERQLVEANSWSDRFWGVNYKKSGLVWFPDDGRNKLGKILMTTRNALK